MPTPTQDPLLTIGQLAERAGLNTSHIRLYERVGVLPKPERVSGQRRYQQVGSGGVDRVGTDRGARARQHVDLTFSSRRGRAPAPMVGGLIRVRQGHCEPLVLIHGLGFSWRAWKPVLPMLARAHDVLALDLPGFGTASPLPDPPTIAALADAVEAELDRLGLGAVHVAGNSLGGWIALELAQRGRATSVVALGPSGLETPVERVGVIFMNEWMRARNVAATPAAALLTGDPISRSAMLGILHGRPWRVPAADAATEILDYAKAPGSHATLHATIGSMKSAGLEKIRVPVRICFGTQDLMIGAQNAPRFAAAIPHATCRWPTTRTSSPTPSPTSRWPGRCDSRRRPRGR